MAAQSENCATLLKFKAEGNEAYKAKDYEAATAAYSKGIKHGNVPSFPDDSDDDEGGPSAADIMKSTDPELLKQGAVVLCNRAASYMGLNKPIPALADAQRASSCDPTNWKAHWREGLCLMMMQPRLERSEHAITAFENTQKCASLPESEKTNVQEALNRAKYRLEQGKDALDMPDMSVSVASACASKKSASAMLCPTNGADCESCRIVSSAERRDGDEMATSASSSIACTDLVRSLHAAGAGPVSRLTLCLAHGCAKALFFRNGARRCAATMNAQNSIDL